MTIAAIGQNDYVMLYTRNFYFCKFIILLADDLDKFEQAWSKSEVKGMFVCLKLSCHNINKEQGDNSSGENLSHNFSLIASLVSHYKNAMPLFVAMKPATNSLQVPLL